ncbi:MAG TPA: hypothetical protein VGG74_34245 [Kofleriaceae bacterium]|jgi:hypothetical protein
MKTASALVLLLAAAAPARAQTADAETLFREGKRLMKKGDVAEACKRFDASEKLEPSVGTELNLANCLDKNGQTASSWATFVKAAASAKRANEPKREAEARKRADALEKQLVYLTIDVPEDDRVPGETIKRNDVAVEDAAWGQRTPVDPDDYTITAEADGYATWTSHVTVKAKNRRIEVPALVKQETKPAAAPSPVASSERAAPPPPVTESRLRKGPITLAAIGVAGIAAGGVLGLLSKNAETSADTACPSIYCGDASALSLNSRARNEALGADVGFAVGGAALAAAVIWWAVAGTSTTERVSVVPALDHLGIVAEGRF